MKFTDNLIFIDFEASGLGQGSWPIEVGLATIEDNQIVTCSSLINPASDWPESGWDNISAQVHRIPRSDLATAMAAIDVAWEVHDRIGVRRVVSDAPRLDEYLCAALFKKLGAKVPKMIRIERAIIAACDGDPKAISAAQAMLTAPPIEHRAGLDAARLAKAVWYGALIR